MRTLKGWHLKPWGRGEGARRWERRKRPFPDCFRERSWIMRGVVLLTLGAALSVTGCSNKPDYKLYADDRVREQLSGRFEKREAIPFFEDRGRFFFNDTATT